MKLCFIYYLGTTKESEALINQWLEYSTKIQRVADNKESLFIILKVFTLYLITKIVLLSSVYSPVSGVVGLFLVIVIYHLLSAL